MRPRSVIHRTEAAAVAFDGEVADRGRYLVYKTPKNPGYHWGNYLLYPGPPTVADADPERGWIADFRREFPGGLPRDRVTLAWDVLDGAEGATDAFLAQGFVRDDSFGMVAGPATLVPGPRHNPEVVVRPLGAAREFAEAARIVTAAFAEGARGGSDEVRVFAERQLERYRAMAAAGFGVWYGASLEGALVGALGVIAVEELGRYQLVATHPAAQRRGVCQSLVYEAGRRALAERRVRTLAIATATDGGARSVYEAVGFRPDERLPALTRARGPSPIR
ncbi:MAG: GNAT family N-acetyltransferase [Myxococcales bacterium]|nr:GNAT family N-acetyltransferase [Myxococcales bacterium]